MCSAVPLDCAVLRQWACDFNGLVHFGDIKASDSIKSTASGDKEDLTLGACAQEGNLKTHICALSVIATARNLTTANLFPRTKGISDHRCGKFGSCAFP